MEELSNRVGKGHLFIESNDLVKNPEATLKKVSKWLNLMEPLKTTYSTFKDTGVMGYGDPLGNIKSGVLITTEGYPNIEVPEHLLQKARLCYNKCKATLLKNIV